MGVGEARRRRKKRREDGQVTGGGREGGTRQVGESCVGLHERARERC